MTYSSSVDTMEKGFLVSNTFFFSLFFLSFFLLLTVREFHS
jgi:hypothetical protein